MAMVGVIIAIYVSWAMLMIVLQVPAGSQVSGEESALTYHVVVTDIRSLWRQIPR
jgi:hypothetical protein